MFARTSTRSLLAALLLLAAQAARPATVDFIGEVSFQVDWDRMTVDVAVEELRNSSRNEGTGTLYL